MPQRRFPIVLFLFFLFAIFTLGEIALLWWLTTATSFWFTLGVTILSAIIGSGMAKRAGVSVLARARTDLGAGKFPAQPLADGVMILIGGAFLITPGLITDLIGYTILIPFFRRLYAKLLIRWVKKNVKFTPLGVPGFGPGPQIFGAPRPGPERRDGVFDAEAGSFRSEKQSKPAADAGEDAVDVEFKRTDI